MRRFKLTGVSASVTIAIMYLSSPAFAAEYFYVNGNDIRENSAILSNQTVNQAKFQSGLFGGIGLSENKTLTLTGDFTNIALKNEETASTVGVIVRYGSTVNFNADNTTIDVTSVGSSGYWGYGLLVNGPDSKAYFNGKSVSIKNYQDAYTSQTLTVKETNVIEFNNSGDVYISAKSPFGVTVVDAYGELTFNNSGNVTLEGTIVPGTHNAQTNVVGIQGDNAKWTVTDKVQNLNINLSGAGVDNDGTSYSTGTVAISGGNTDFTFHGQALNINMDIPSGVEIDVPGSHTAEEAYGIDFEGGKFVTGENSSVSIKINESLGSAYALHFYRGANGTFNGGVNISSQGKKFSTAILNNDAVLNFFGQNNVFTGDIIAEDQDHDTQNTPTEINFKSGSSVINGSTSIEDTSKLTATDSSLQFNGKLEQSGNGEITLNNSDAHISDYGAAINNLTGKNSTVWLDGLKENSVNLLSVQSNQAENLTIGINGKVNDQFKNSQETIAAVKNAVAISNSTDQYSYSVNEGLVNNAVEVKVAEDGKILSTVEKTNSVTSSTAELAKLNGIAWRNELTSLTDRMSTLRTAPEFAGVWAHYKGGEWDGDGINQQFNGVEIGVDKAFGPNFVLGLAASYIEGDGDLDNGSADTDNYSGAAYLSYYNGGWFVDVMGKLGKIKTDFDLYNTSGIKDSGDYTMSGYLFGVETGYRFNFNNFFVEPQVQLTYSYLGSKEFTTDNRTVDFETLESLVGRVGFMSGYDFGDIGSAYLRASYYHDFDGDIKLNVGNGTAFDNYSDELDSDWGDVGVGANVNFSGATLFFDVSRTYGGDIDMEWKANAGARYSF